MLYSCKTKSIVNNNQSTIVNIKAIGEKPLLIRQPYLQMVRPTTSTITWKTNLLVTNCSVVYNELNSLEKTVVKGFLTEHEGNKFNEVVIVNLKPETTYNYAIYSNGHLLETGEKIYI
ncbi:hypothetical protein BTO07_06630 [Polaribacter sp. SA4-12]|nr:hypothetical protein BTO07_06630 [Polaribacter sp. SA4-12]